MSTRFWQGPVAGFDNFEQLTGGHFQPKGTGAPVIPKPNGGAHVWTVSRIAAGRFLVTMTGRPIGSLIKGIRTTLQIDPAGSDINLDSSVGPVTIVGGNTCFEIDVVDTTTQVLTDITQPVSPTNQGSFVHWHLRWSEDPFLSVQE